MRWQSAAATPLSTANRASKAAWRFASRRSPKRIGCGFATLHLCVKNSCLALTNPDASNRADVAKPLHKSGLFVQRADGRVCRVARPWRRIFRTDSRAWSTVLRVQKFPWFSGRAALPRGYGVSIASRTFLVKSRGLNGFCRKNVPGLDMASRTALLLM